MTGEPDPPELFRLWARAATGTAAQNTAKHDRYGAQLADIRARVYSEAAELIEQHNAAEAVRVMVERAGHCAVLTPPLHDFDRIGLRYIAARAWQLCARTLDPNTPEIQKPWD